MPAVIRMRCTIDEIFAAREYAFQKREGRKELLCRCGCDHPDERCTCGFTQHEYEPSGVHIEACAKCGLPNVPDHPCK